MSNFHEPPHPAPDPYRGGPHGGHQGPYPAEPAPPPPPYAEQRRPRREGEGADRAALVIHTIADIAAGFLGLWILLYLLEANQSNIFVTFVESVADWLAGWSQDIFTMDTEGLRVLLNYGLPAIIYLGIGHGLAARIRRL
ncbi:hypothetical protein [Streptomyces sp. ODS28]|uniref:hypothetical protein n=1 Tax=Streptomyces sp. ODS28 TaxID=3136688 RepID=UPI0031E551FF